MYYMISNPTVKPYLVLQLRLYFFTESASIKMILQIIQGIHYVLKKPKFCSKSTIPHP